MLRAAIAHTTVLCHKEKTYTPQHAEYTYIPSPTTPDTQDGLEMDATHMVSLPDMDAYTANYCSELASNYHLPSPNCPEAVSRSDFSASATHFGHRKCCQLWLQKAKQFLY